MARNSANSSSILRCTFLARRRAKLIANFSATMVTSLPSFSLSLSLYLSLSHRMYLTHNIGSASALPIIGKRLCVRLLEVTNMQLSKSADRKAQTSPVRRRNAFLICDLQIFSAIKVCVHYLEQPHAQSLFLFPIVFGVNLIHFLDGLTTVQPNIRSRSCLCLRFRVPLLNEVEQRGRAFGLLEV